MALLTSDRRPKFVRPIALRVRFGRAEWIAAALITAALSAAGLAARLDQRDRAGATKVVAPQSDSAKASASEGAATGTAPAVQSAGASKKEVAPNKDNRSLQSVFALLRATRWGESFGDAEEAEEMLYAQTMFASGAYVGESKVFKGYVCLVRGGDDECEGDGVWAATFGASESKVTAEGVKDLASLAAYNAAYAKIEANISTFATTPRSRAQP